MSKYPGKYTKNFITGDLFGWVNKHIKNKWTTRKFWKNGRANWSKRAAKGYYYVLIDDQLYTAEAVGNAVYAMGAAKIEISKTITVKKAVHWYDGYYHKKPQVEYSDLDYIIRGYDLYNDPFNPLLNSLMNQTNITTIDNEIEKAQGISSFGGGKGSGVELKTHYKIKYNE